ncbi:hypothetical protein BDC45DRAFT_133335 [Circinella umbellata]|nr:hypothetical protein BDC45DRAFT_133335 [Circinella umbellata]
MQKIWGMLLLPKIDVSHTKAITAKNIAKSITEPMKLPSTDLQLLEILKESLKEAKKDKKDKLKKAVSKVINVYRRQFLHGKNILEEEQSEGNYVATFLYPIFDHLFRDCADYVIMWGESKMKAVKYILDDDGLDDKDRRSNTVEPRFLHSRFLHTPTFCTPLSLNPTIILLCFRPHFLHTPGFCTTFKPNPTCAKNGVQL